MALENLTADQIATYGRFAGPPTQDQLERFFLLDEGALDLVNRRRRDANRLGFAVQLGTVRFLGTFLSDLRETPQAVVQYVAAQLNINRPECFAQYSSRAKTAYEHVCEISERHGYRAFSDAQGQLQDYLAARAWISSDGPRALFDRASAWLVERKALLPAAEVVARLVAEARVDAAHRAWSEIRAGVSDDVTDRLLALLSVPAQDRLSLWEHLRISPMRVCRSVTRRVPKRAPIDSLSSTRSEA